MNVPDISLIGVRWHQQCIDIAPAVAQCENADVQAQSICKSKQQSEILDCEKAKDESHAECAASQQTALNRCKQIAKSEIAGSAPVRQIIIDAVANIIPVSSQQLPPAARSTLSKAYSPAFLDSIKIVRMGSFDTWYSFVVPKNSFADVKKIQLLPYSDIRGVSVVENHILIDKNVTTIPIGELVSALELTKKYSELGIDGVAQTYSYARAYLDAELLTGEQKACTALDCHQSLEISD